MADHPDPIRIRLRYDFSCKRLLLLLLFKADEPDFDQFMPQEPVANGLDHSRYQPFFPDQDDRLAIMGYASKICFLKSLQFCHGFLLLDWFSRLGIRR